MGCFEGQRNERGRNHEEPIQHNRSCTDILFLIVFIVFLVLWGFVGVYGFKYGSMEKLLAPMDSQGRRCGLDPGLEDKKNLVFINIAKCLLPGAIVMGCPTTQVCVDKCPERTIFFDETMFNQSRSSMVCMDGINVEALTWNETIRNIYQEKCTGYVISSQPVVNRCFVNITEAMTIIRRLNVASVLDLDEVLSHISSLVQFDQLSTQIMQDLVQSQWYLLGALIVVIVVCFLYILLLRLIVAPVIWVSIGAVFAALGFCIFLCYKNYAYYKEFPADLVPTTNLKGYVVFVLTKNETWLFLLTSAAIITGILLLIIIFLRKRIAVAIALIHEASKAVFAVKSTVFFPMFPWILQCFVIAYGGIVCMYLISIGDNAFEVINLESDTNCSCNGVYKKLLLSLLAIFHLANIAKRAATLDKDVSEDLLPAITDYESCNPIVFAANCHDVSMKMCQRASCHFTGIDNPLSIVWLHLVNLLGFFWTMFFISGMSNMILASTFSTWYWTLHKRDVPLFTLTTGIYRTVRYHMGTVAFGSLIIAIVRIIRIILEYIDHKLKKFDNPITRCITCFCKCFFWCLEKFIKFINKNAYIMCAVNGKNFCLSAKDAFSLILRNAVRAVVLDKVTDFIFFLSKVLISIGVGTGVYYCLQWKFVYEMTNGERLNYNFIPAIILTIAAYIISTVFFKVYAMAVDTLFLCFLEDCERNDGSPEKPYFMSKDLMKIIGKKNVK